MSALLRMRLCSSRVEAAAVGWCVPPIASAARRAAEPPHLGSSFLMHGIVHHVVDDHNFKDEPMFYRFRRDDGTYKGDSRPYRTAAVMAVRLHGTIRSRHPELIADRDYGLSTFKRCFVGMHLVDHLMRERGMSWEQAEAIGKKLGQAGFIRHVCDDHEFEGKWLFYRFTFDKLKTDAGFLEFTKLKQGLEYLGHLEQPLQRQPSPSPRRRTESGGGDLPPVPSPARDRLGSASSSLSMMPPLPPPRSSSNASRLGTPPRLAGSSYPAARGGGGGPPEPAPGEHCAAVLAAPWYYGEIGREDTQQVFQRAGRSDDGAWLFRDFARCHRLVRAVCAPWQRDFSHHRAPAQGEVAD